MRHELRHRWLYNYKVLISDNSNLKWEPIVSNYDTMKIVILGKFKSITGIRNSIQHWNKENPFFKKSKEVGYEFCKIDPKWYFGQSDFISSYRNQE